MIRPFLNLVLIAGLIFSPLAQSGASQSFTKNEVILMNSFSNSHEVFKAYLKLKNTPIAFTAAVREELKKKSTPMPKFSLLKNGEIGYAIEGQDYRLARESKTVFRVNGQRMDINSSEWNSEKSAMNSFLGIPIWIDNANALAPVVLGAIYILSGAVVVTGMVCVLPDTSGLFKPSGAKMLTVSSTHSIDRKFTGWWKSNCPVGTCTLCADELPPDFAFGKYFIKLCSRIAKNYATADDVDVQAEKMERRYSPRQNSIPRSMFMVDVATVHESFRLKPGNSMPSPSVEAYILAHLTNQEFMKGCVKEFLPVSPTSPRTLLPGVLYPPSEEPVLNSDSEATTSN